MAGANTRAELLAHDELALWARAHPARGYESVLASPDLDWKGEVGTPDGVVASRTDWRDWVAHVFGPPPMVDAVATVLRSRGLSTDNLRADAFTAGASDLDGPGSGR